MSDIDASTDIALIAVVMEATARDETAAAIRLVQTSAPSSAHCGQVGGDYGKTEGVKEVVFSHPFNSTDADLLPP